MCVYVVCTCVYCNQELSESLARLYHPNVMLFWSFRKLMSHADWEFRPDMGTIDYAKTYKYVVFVYLVIVQSTTHKYYFFTGSMPYQSIGVVLT